MGRQIVFQKTEVNPIGNETLGISRVPPDVPHGCTLKGNLKRKFGAVRNDVGPCPPDGPKVGAGQCRNFRPLRSEHPLADRSNFRPASQT